MATCCQVIPLGDGSASETGEVTIVSESFALGMRLSQESNTGTSNFDGVRSGKAINSDAAVQTSNPISQMSGISQSPDPTSVLLLSPIEADDGVARLLKREASAAESADENEDEDDDENATAELLERLESLSEDYESLKEEWSDFQDGLKDEKEAKKNKPATTIGGRVHIDNWNFSQTDPGINVIERFDEDLDPEDRWTFRRIRLEMAGNVPGNMFWRIQVDFNRPSIPEMKDVYLGWSGLANNHKLILGNQKRPLGLDHLNSSRFNVFAERPLAVETFNEDARRFGLAMYGHTDSEAVAWTYGIYNLENINTSGRFIGDALQMGGYGRLWSTPWYDETSGGRGYWHMAIAGAVAKPDGDGSFDRDTNNNEGRFRTRPLARSSQRWLNTGRIPGADWYEVLAFENIFNAGAFQLTGEYFLTAMQRDDVAPPGGPIAPYTPPLDEDLFFHGGYVYMSYFLTGEHNPYRRTSGTLQRVTPYENFFAVDRCTGGTGRGWGAWQVALRYDHLDLTDGGVNGGVANIVTAGMNWHWTAYSKVQMNAIWGTIDESGNAGDFDGGDFAILGFRYMVDF